MAARRPQPAPEATKAPEAEPTIVPTPTPGLATVGSGATKIVWWHISTVDDQGANWQNLANKYVEQHPDVSIESTILENEAFKAKLATAMPLMRPALAAVVVLTMVGSWNAFFLPLLVLNTESLYTLPLGITQFQGQFGADWAKVLAFVSPALLPTIVFYLLAERQIIAGLTAGAVKG